METAYNMDLQIPEGHCDYWGPIVPAGGYGTPFKLNCYDKGYNNVTISGSQATLVWYRLDGSQNGPTGYADANWFDAQGFPVFQGAPVCVYE